VWRTTLESPHTAERQVFADLPELFAYLERLTGDIDLAEPTEDRLDDDDELGVLESGPGWLE
jgi:hypothetical protein